MRRTLSILWRDKLTSVLVLFAAVGSLAGVFLHGDGVRILGVATFLAIVASLFTRAKTAGERAEIADQQDTKYRRSDAETESARAGESIKELERRKRSESG